MTGSPLRILLAEDNDVYRATLALLLDGRDGIEIIGEIADGRAVAEAAARLQPDVVVLDYRLPGMDGDEVTAAVRAAWPAASVVCLTAEATPEERERVLAAGAATLVEKGCPTQEIIDAIRSRTTP